VTGRYEYGRSVEPKAKKEKLFCLHRISLKKLIKRGPLQDEFSLSCSLHQCGTSIYETSELLGTKMREGTILLGISDCY